MCSETDDLVANLFLKPAYDGHTQEHQRHTHGNTRCGNAHNGPRDACFIIGATNSLGYVGSNTQLFKISTLFGVKVNGHAS